MAWATVAIYGSERVNTSLSPPWSLKQWLFRFCHQRNAFVMYTKLSTCLLLSEDISLETFFWLPY